MSEEMELYVVLDDGDTFSGITGATIVALTDEQADKASDIGVRFLEDSERMTLYNLHEIIPQYEALAEAAYALADARDAGDSSGETTAVAKLLSAIGR